MKNNEDNYSNVTGYLFLSPSQGPVGAFPVPGEHKDLVERPDSPDQNAQNAVGEGVG